MTCLAYCVDKELWKAIDYLKEQVRILKEQQEKDTRILLNDRQRIRLAAKTKRPCRCQIAIRSRGYMPLALHSQPTCFSPILRLTAGTVASYVPMNLLTLHPFSRNVCWESDRREMVQSPLDADILSGMPSFFASVRNQRAATRRFHRRSTGACCPAPPLPAAKGPMARQWL